MPSLTHRNDACTLVIMAKAPRTGAVKTRLARGLQTAEVTDLYRCLLADTIALGQSLDGVDVAIMCPEADADQLAGAAGDSISVVPQKGIGLAAALCSAFAHFSAAGAGRVVAFNSDTPHLPKAFLENAFRSLASVDVVVGPTEDGGYYLVGASASHPELFVSDVMGTTNAYEALLARIRALNLSLHLTEPFYDIDELADLDRLAEELQGNPGKAPQTAEWLTARAEKMRQTEQSGQVT